MLERGRDPDLAEEPITPQDGRQLGLEHLDGDSPAVLQVFGEKHDGHPAVAELPLHAVSIAEGCREVCEESMARLSTGERCGPYGGRQADHTGGWQVAGQVVQLATATRPAPSATVRRAPVALLEVPVLI